MKDNGKMEVVKNCTTCQHIEKLGEGAPCSECRMSYPPADADDYNLMWELRETLAAAPEGKRVIVPGDDVIYNCEEYKVLCVGECGGNRVLEVLKIEIDEGNSGEFEISHMILREDWVKLKLPELTAKEYAEKLREYFGIEEPPVTHGKLCAAVICKECAFHAEPAWCEAAMLLFDPAAGMERIQAQNHRDKPKGKTYLQDFIEKHPNAPIGPGKIPWLCLKNAYGEEASADDICEAHNCLRCWSREMPEAGDENG